VQCQAPTQAVRAVRGRVLEPSVLVETLLNTEFPLKDLGEPDKFLGCHLIRDYENSTIILSQAPYVDKILTESGLTECWPNTIPMDPKYLKINEEIESPVDSSLYLHVIGQLNWLAIKTRPDIQFAVSRLQRKSAKPNTEGGVV
jgi:hypothetical protein